jgi:hypothetical protein
MTCVPICQVSPDVKRCNHGCEKHREVTRYAVLDDDDDCLDELPLFQPSSKTGITEEICCAVEAYLAGRSDKDMRANAIVRLGQNIRSIFKRDKS